MNEAHRLRQLQRIEEAIAHDERAHTPEEIADAAEEYFAQRSGRRCAVSSMQQPELDLCFAGRGSNDA